MRAAALPTLCVGTKVVLPGKVFGGPAVSHNRNATIPHVVNDSACAPMREQRIGIFECRTRRWRRCARLGGVNLLVRLAYNLLRGLTWPVWGLWRVLARRRVRWVRLDLRGGLAEIAPPRPRWLPRLPTDPKPHRVHVHGIRRLVDKLRADPGVAGVWVTLGPMRGGWASLASLRQELDEIVRAGKRVVVFMPEGGDQRELFLASCAHTAAAPASAGFRTLGPLGRRTYAAALLQKLGVQIEVMAQGRYKSAADGLVRDSMSEAEREQTLALVRSVHEEWVAALDARSGLAAAGVQSLFEEAVYGASRAVALGLIDRCAFQDELEEAIGISDAGQGCVTARRYISLAPRPLFVPLRRRKRVALLHLSGPITERDGPAGIGLAATTSSIQSLRKRADVEGVLAFVDSPGGSALASDLLHHELGRLAAAKPLVACMGDVAASGGYYLAVAASRIVARPTTITGSIGVIAIHAVLAQLFASVGIREEIVKLTPFADLQSPLRPLDQAERALLDAEAERYYTRFVEVVAQGRGRTVEEIRGLAEGRVWSGRDAHARGLVDELGGYREARAALDTLLPERGRRCETEPLLVSRAVRPRWSSLLGIRADSRFHPRLRHSGLRELLALIGSTRNVLAYALDLPQL